MDELSNVTDRMHRDGKPVCKCCGHRTTPFARVNANRTCADPNGPVVFPPSQDWVCYVQCRRCGFLFTDHFDGYSEADMLSRIYNDDYILADPDFAEKRPGELAAYFGDVLHPLRDRVEALDYGGGNGRFASAMRERGFRFDSFDPYFGDDVAREGTYDIVTCFEVLEHSRNPLGTLRSILECLKPGGAILFSTNLQPRLVTEDWSYIGPRNGHVSLFSERSLHVLAHKCDARFLPLNDWLHLMYFATFSSTARLLLNEWKANSVLYNASLRGISPVGHAILHIGTLGFPEAANPRHLVRALLATLTRGGRQRTSAK